MQVFVIGTRGFPDVQGGVEKHCEMLYPLIAKKGWNIRYSEESLTSIVPTLITLSSRCNFTIYGP